MCSRLGSAAEDLWTEEIIWIYQLWPFCQRFSFFFPRSVLDGKQTCMNKIKQFFFSFFCLLQKQDDWIRFTFLIAAVKRIWLEWRPCGTHMCSPSSAAQRSGDLQTNIMKREDKMGMQRGHRAEQRIKQIKHWSQTVRAAWRPYTHKHNTHTSVQCHANRNSQIKQQHSSNKAKKTCNDTKIKQILCHSAAAAAALKVRVTF